MAFTTRRGRPRATPVQTDPGTPELRLKHALGATSEPIDLCLSKQVITPDQHWCGLHLRWLYTLRYGAPVVSTRYADDSSIPSADDDMSHWRTLREQEYRHATALLQQHRRYDCVMRACVYNELPAFLNPGLQKKSWDHPALADRLAQQCNQLQEGLELLVKHWKHGTNRRG